MKEEVNEAEEIYPIDPRPSTVEVKFPKTNDPATTCPIAEENEEIVVANKVVVEAIEDVKEAVEIYPIEPRPPTVLVNDKEEIAFKLNNPLPFPVYKLAVTFASVVVPSTLNVPFTVTGAAA